MSTGESNPNQPNSDGNRCDSGRDGEPAAISGDLVGASEGAPELDELVAIAAQRCRLDHRESVLLAEIAQTDVCDVLHGHHPNVWFADRTRQARYTASSACAPRSGSTTGTANWPTRLRPGWLDGNTLWCSIGPPTAASEQP